MRPPRFLEQPASPRQETPTLLAHLKVGDDGLVRHVNGRDDSVSRLMEMGLIPGTMVRVNHVAPKGDLFQLTLRAYSLSMRGYDLSIGRSEAERVQVDRLS